MNDATEKEGEGNPSGETDQNSDKKELNDRYKNQDPDDKGTPPAKENKETNPKGEDGDTDDETKGGKSSEEDEAGKDKSGKFDPKSVVIEFDHIMPRKVAQEVIDGLRAEGAPPEYIAEVLQGRREIVERFLEDNPGMASPPTEADIKKDNTLGGEHFSENLTLAKRAVGEFGGDFDKLAKSGQVYNKEIFSILVKAGKTVVGKSMPGRNNTPGGSGMEEAKKELDSRYSKSINI